LQSLDESEKRALSFTNTALGASFIDDGMSEQYVRKLKYYNAVRQVANIIDTGEDTAPWDVPVIDDTALIGVQEADNTALTEVDLATENVNLTPCLVHSGVQRSPIRLLRASKFNAEEWIVSSLSALLGRKENSLMTTGTVAGNNTIQGCVTGSSLGTTASSTSAISLANLDDLIGSLDPAYEIEGELALMGTQATRTFLLKLVDLNGRPIFDFGTVDNRPQYRVRGVPFIVNPDQANIGASAKSLLFGNFKRGYWIRDCGPPQTIVSNVYELYMQMAHAVVHYVSAGVVDSRALKHLVHAAS